MRSKEGGEKLIYIYNPINNTKSEIDYELLSGMTGIPIEQLRSYKSKDKKIGNINSYIIDDTTTVKARYQLMLKEKIKDEIWKNIDGSEGKYQISSAGRARRVCKHKNVLLMPYKRKGGKLFVKITLNQKIKEVAVHTLVATHFIENEEELPCIYHKNENITDNFAGNLQWINRHDLAELTAYKSKAIAVLKIDKASGEVLEEYESMAEAGRINYLHRETIRQCVRGKLKTAGGFKWIIDTGEYFEEVV
jgi:hypothetical protein